MVFGWSRRRRRTGFSAHTGASLHGRKKRRSSSRTRVSLGRGRFSQHFRLPHHRLRLRADYLRHFVRIALLEFRQEKLHGKRPRVTLVRKLAQDLSEWAHTVARDETRCLVEHFAWHIRHVLKVDVRDFAWADAINTLELIVAGPEMIAI